MAISRPRTSRQARSLKPVRFTPCEFRFASIECPVAGAAAPDAEAALLIRASPSHSASPLTRAPIGNNPINASAIIVLPLPDSPTSPSDSPAVTCRDTSFTGRTQPEGVGNSTVNSCTRSRLVMTPFKIRAELRIAKRETMPRCLGGTALQLPFVERQDKLQRGMGRRNAYDLYVLQAGLAAGGEDVAFGDLFFGFGIDDPEGGGALYCFGGLVDS